MPQTRKLAAIMFTDIVGYTALMGKDEEKAFRILEINRQIHKQALQEFNGTWLKEIGDGVLASFDTITDAVYCAKKIQEQCNATNQYALRIGIHQGEVVFEGEDVFGDGVNLASRIQAAAPPGGIYLSESVARNIDNKKDIETVYAGEKKLKNVSYPVKVYEIVSTGNKRIPANKFSLLKKQWLKYAALVILLAVVGYFAISFLTGGKKITSEKTIAVLPFKNLNPNDSSNWFVTGIHEDVINRLAALKDLKVISRTSVLRINDSTLDLKQIGKKLDAAFIVEGLVSRINNQVKVNVQLIDAKTDKSIWSESYDREMSNMFEMQSDIALEISNALNAKISRQEKDRINTIPTENIAAYDDFVRGRAILHSSQLGYDKLMQGIALLEKATTADKNFAEAWGLLSQAQSLRFQRLSNYDGRDDEKQQAAEASEKSLNNAKRIDPNGVAALRAEGYYYQTVKQDPVSALRSFDRALEVFPNDATTLVYEAFIFFDLGQINRCIDNLERAYALDKGNPSIIYGLTFGYELAKQYKKMVPFFEKLLELEPEKTQYAVQAKYFNFLAEGSLDAFKEFETAVKTVRKTDVYDERSVENNEMIVAMVNDEIDKYAQLWEGKWQAHYAGHGDWACPMIVNEEVNQAYFLKSHGDAALASQFIERAVHATARPVNDHALCMFDKAAYEPKLLYLTGDSAKARKEFDESVVKILKNKIFPRGAVEKSVLLQTADMVAPDRVYSICKEILKDPVSFIGMEVICANPWTYPNLIKNPEFVKEVKQDGRFVKFLQHYKLIP